MFDSTQMKNDIKAIEDIFLSLDLKGSKDKILESLSFFEQKTGDYKESPYFFAIIKWYKNIFLQKAGYFVRAEQLLDEILKALEKNSEPFCQHWKLKTYISLGYVHNEQWNYLDAESYLMDAVELALSEPSFSKFLGEIYALLSTVNLSLGRYGEAIKYSRLEKEICSDQYRAQSSDASLGISYAYSLINHSRINRLIDLPDLSIRESLDESIGIFNRFKKEKGEFIARMELAEFLYMTNMADDALQSVLVLEPIFKERKMYKQLIQAKLLAIKIYRKLFAYNRMKDKCNEIEILAKEQCLETTPIMADILLEMGAVFYAMNQDIKALGFYKRAAKLGMILGIKTVIKRAFDASKSIDKYKANELLSSDLVYKDNVFLRNRLEPKISPFYKARAKIKLFATSMFVDIIGFSALMKKIDQDTTVRMIDELIDRMYLIIYQNNGYIDKFLGDGFMAIFEHGSAFEPELAFNAIISGTDIDRALNHKNRKLKKIYGIKKYINVRIGISTGEIYAIWLGNYIKTEFTYLGNSVNLASKLESQANKGFILIDDKTNQLVKDRILSEPEQIIIPGLGETKAHHVKRLARMFERSIK